MKQGKATSQVALARKDKLVVQELPHETLVYDLERHKAHCLNTTAAFVWNRCDGHTGVSEIAGQLSRELNKPVADDVIWLALKQLQKANLLAEQVVAADDTSKLSRREVVRRLGIASAPLVLSLVAPTAAQAQTIGIPGVCQECFMDVTAGSCTPTCLNIPGRCHNDNGCPGIGGFYGNMTCQECAACADQPNRWTAPGFAPGTPVVNCCSTGATAPPGQITPC